MADISTKRGPPSKRWLSLLRPTSQPIANKGDAMKDALAAAILAGITAAFTLAFFLELSK